MFTRINRQNLLYTYFIAMSVINLINGYTKISQCLVNTCICIFVLLCFVLFWILIVFGNVLIVFVLLFVSIDSFDLKYNSRSFLILAYFRFSTMVYIWLFGCLLVVLFICKFMAHFLLYKSCKICFSSRRRASKPPSFALSRSSE